MLIVLKLKEVVLSLIIFLINGASIHVTSIGLRRMVYWFDFVVKALIFLIIFHSESIQCHEK